MKARQKVLNSLLASFGGWLSGFVSYEIISLVKDGSFSDVFFALIWPGIFIAVWWGVFLLPVILLTRDTNPIFSIGLGSVFGAVYGLAGFFILTGWFLRISFDVRSWLTPETSMLCISAIVAGAVTMFIYTIQIRKIIGLKAHT